MPSVTVKCNAMSHEGPSSSSTRLQLNFATSSMRSASTLSRTGLRLDLCPLANSEQLTSPGCSARSRKAAFDPLHSDLSPIDPTLSLEKQAWYHGSISRSEAERLLYSAREGSFLIRNCETTPSRTGPTYSVAIKSAKGYMHIKILKNPDGYYVLGVHSKCFSTIPEMVHYYSLNRLPIKGAEHMSLRRPILYQLL